MWNPHHNEHSGRRRHDRDSKGPRFEVPRGGARWAADADRNTTKELRSITTQYVANNMAAQLRTAPSDSREASSISTIQDIGEGTKGGSKRRIIVFRRLQPQLMATVATASKQAALAWCML
jgi:hypothetical protein